MALDSIVRHNMMKRAIDHTSDCQPRSWDG